MPTFLSEADEIDHCLQREREERQAADTAHDPTDRDTHFMLAERFADRAWSLNETGGSPFIPSGLWR